MKLTIDIPIDSEFLENAERSKTGSASVAFVEYVGARAEEIAEDAAEKHLLQAGAVI